MFKFIRFRDWPLFVKTILLSLIIIASFAFFISQYSLPFFRNILINEKRSSIEALVDVAVSSISLQLNREKLKELTFTEAQSEALKTISSLKYSNEEYFFVLDLNGAILWHPDEKLLHTNMESSKDVNGYAFIAAIIDGAKSQGHGSVDYFWPKPNTETPLLKITGYRLIPEWGWIIATGIWAEDIDDSVLSLSNTVWTYTIIGSLIAGVVVFIFSFFITLPIRSFLKKSRQLVDGDFTVSIETKRDDEIGKLIQSVVKIVNRLVSVVNQVIPVSVKIDESMVVLRSAVEHTVAGTEKQADRAGQISAASEEITQTVAEIARTATSSTTLSNEAMKTALAGRKYAELASSGVKQVNNAASILIDRIERMNQATRQIGEVVDLIRSVAEQTNLIALNASIEASRAGLAGSRFSVIAEEVRKLARNAGDATADVNRIVESVKSEMTEIREAMKAVDHNLESASGAIVSTDQTLDRIVGNFKEVDHNITQIAAAIEELSITSRDVAQNIAETMNISGDIKEMAQRVKTEFNRLVVVAEGLRESTGGIKTDVTQKMILDLAKTDHRLFIEKIDSCLSGESDLQPEDLANHRHCRFGKWYFSEGVEKCGHLQVFKDIDTPHNLVHKLGRDAVSLYRSGQKEQAIAAYMQAEDQSHNIISLIEELKKQYQTE
ncbi:MAG: cache domain-containing protein [Leptonema sp. (in: Bacteria)]|nr:cache domain-containing protein [Leptonema sp. (in: bacteria)]